MNDDCMLTRTEAAKYLTISTRQLDRLRLPRSKIGRRTIYRPSDLSEFVAASKIQCVADLGGGPKLAIRVPDIRAQKNTNKEDRQAEMLKLLS